MISNIINTVKKYSPEIILFFIVFILLFLGTDSTPISDGDTFYYIAKAKKMLATGNFFGTNNIMAKPILGLWIIAAVYKFCGISLFTTYLWNSLFALSAIVLIYKFGTEIKDRHYGFLSATVLLTSFAFFYQARSPMLDMMLLFFVTLTQYYLYKYIKTLRAEYFYKTAVAAGLTFLTKGLLGLLIPAATFFFYLIINKKNPLKEHPEFLKRCLIALLIISAIISIWLVPQFAAHGKEFGTLMYRENIVRFFKPIDASGSYTETPEHAQRDYYSYLIYLLFFFLPWSPFIIPAFIKMYKSNYFGNKPFYLQMAIWSFFTFILFSFSGHYKIPRYILPLYPALALIVGRFLREILETKLTENLRLIRRTFAFVSIVILLVIFYLLINIFPGNVDQYKLPLALFMVSYLLVILSGYYYVLKEKINLLISVLFYGSALSYLLLIAVMNISLTRGLPEVTMSKFVKAAVNENIPLISWNIHIRSLEFYLPRRKINSFSNKKELRTFLNSHTPPLYLVTPEAEIKGLTEISKKLVYKQNGWILFSLTK